MKNKRTLILIGAFFALIALMACAWLPNGLPGSAPAPVSAPEATEAPQMEPAPIEAMPDTGFYTTNEQVFNAIFVACPTDIEGCIDLKPAEVHKCAGEADCFAVTREKDQNEVVHPFAMKLTLDCGSGTFQDGYMDDPNERSLLGRQSPPWPSTAEGSGIPNGFIGLAQGVTIRPCANLPTPQP